MVRGVLGYNPALFAGYSLRRGGVTALMSAPAPPAAEAINGHVGWAPGSRMQGRYFARDLPSQRRAPSAALL